MTLRPPTSHDQRSPDGSCSRQTPSCHHRRPPGRPVRGWPVRLDRPADQIDPILDGLRSVGWGFIVILILSGIRPLVRAAAWRLCTPGPHQLRIRDTFPAFLTGEALGNVTPLGLFVSEPTKAVFVRHRVSMMTAVSGLATENVLYTLSVAVVIATGTVALLFSFDVPRAVRLASTIVVGIMLACSRSRPGC